MNERELEQVVGCWKLVSYEFRNPEGEILPISPWGDDPVGTIIMDDKNHFSAQIMRRERPKFDSGLPSSEVIKYAYAGYMAYFGTFEVNADKGILINRVEGCLNPDWVGGEQIRHLEFSGECLVLRTPPMDTGKTKMTGTFVWEKAGWFFQPGHLQVNIYQCKKNLGNIPRGLATFVKSSLSNPNHSHLPCSLRSRRRFP